MSTHAETMVRNPAALSPATTDRPDRTLAAIVVLAGLALAGTLALLPSSEEKAAGLFEEERYDEAITLLVSLEDQRALNAYEDFMLFKLYVLTKQPDMAAALLEQEGELQFERIWALEQLAALYREGRDYAGEATVLRRLYDASPSDAAFQRLRALYRLTGNVEGEASLLQGAIAAGQAGSPHAERLSYLQSLPQAGGSSALWTVASGEVTSIEAPGIRIVAVTDLAAPQTSSVE
ncbi:tetratricopeptide repeat protein [Devosia sp. XGJD_8]|uniref:tetratricopeptide repeat protein n=1 Tax=Devosia sp. XGJD_8 TaxID=3391187 RepID=UPI0039849D9A